VRIELRNKLTLTKKISSDYLQISIETYTNIIGGLDKYLWVLDDGISKHHGDFHVPIK